MPPALPVPQAWDLLSHRLLAEDLDLPPSLYSLDKSSWISTIIQEVTFDMTALSITVRFLGGASEEWPLADRHCIRGLNAMLKDVRRAAEQERGRTPPRPPPQPVPAKPLKHKKQRSLFHFVVARSVLVDAYRRFVLGELKHRLPTGGYTAWAATASLRATMDQMAAIVDRAGGELPSPFGYPLSRHPSTPFSSSFAGAQRHRVLSPFYDDAGSEYSLTDTLSTDTDGSSVHTPLTTPVGTVERHGRPNPSVSHLPVGFTPEDLETYNALHHHALHLRQLLVHIDIAEKNDAMEEHQLHAVLAVRSKRRAWSNRKYKGGAPMSDLGFATPKDPSPLARYAPINGAYLSSPPRCLSTRTIEYDTATLFPVTEESDEEDEAVDRAARAVQEMRIEDVAAAAAAAPLERPRIRVRTLSTHQYRRALDFDPMLAPEPAVLLVPPPPLSVPKPRPAPDLQRLFDPDGDFGGGGGGEFTLGMDAQDLRDPASAHLYDGREWASSYEFGAR
ncbi:hypothetical protein OF83DRAFT_1084667 [Amylostereum chailletii]|nr:hypothetical protein OF83DRAFT_1084667 [Amylostereum chailletii]